MNQVATLPKRSLVDSMAARYEMEPAAFVGAIKATVIKGECSNEQFAAFLMVAKEYDLNPLAKEIYAFPDRGGIQPIVSIDGWMNLINSHPQFDGMEFVDNMGEDGKLYSVECKMYRKDRQRPTTVIEYMSECFRPTDPWKKWPNRMLRHKAAIQCARYAFGFSGIMEPDEYERMKDVTPPSGEPSIVGRLKAAQQSTEQPTGAREGFSDGFAHAQTETLSGAADTVDPDTGEITDNTDGEATGSSSVTDAEPDAPSSSQAGASAGEDAPASTSASPATNEVDKPFLIELLQSLYAAKGPDPDVVNAQSDLFADRFKAANVKTKDKASTILNQIKMLGAGEIDAGECLEYLAGVIGVEPKDLGLSADE